MHNIFLRIYMGMLLAIVTIAMVTAVSTYWISKARIQAHIYHHYSGTFKLIGEGVARHTNEEREQWLSAIERLSGLSFETHNFSEGLLSNRQLKQLQQKQFLFVVDKSLVTSRAYILLPEEQRYLSVTVDDYGTSLVRISAFLMLNELGRHRNEARLSALQHLRSIYQYPIELKEYKELQISRANIRTLKKGDIAIVLNISGASTTSMKAYAPIGNSRFVLVLGAIPLFDWFPPSQVVIFIIFILMAMAAAVFLLVKPLEKRLAEVDEKIIAIAKDQEINMQAFPRGDAIVKLSATVDSMARRIHKLLEAQTDMVKAISHELRAPITRIRFQLAVLPDEIDPISSVTGIEKNLDELETLIDEVLTFLKLKSHQPEIKTESLAAKEFIEQLVTLHSTVNPNITLRTEVENKLFITADRRYLHRAITNLIINAMKYASSSVTVGTCQTSTAFMIWVSDDGPGIPYEQRAEVFTPFKRLDPSRARQSGGYGLGLSIVQQIANWHSGHVEITESIQGGALVKFIWPMIKDEHEKY